MQLSHTLLKSKDQTPSRPARNLAALASHYEGRYRVRKLCIGTLEWVIRVEKASAYTCGGKEYQYPSSTAKCPFLFTPHS
jgi:hypothetical protein